MCDNTLSAALSEVGQTVKVRHSKYSGFKLDGVRAALAMVHEVADDFTAEVTRRVEWKITDLQFKTVLNALVPVDDALGKAGRTIAERKRSEITALYRHDERAAQWYGTAFGVMQAFNTWEHHVKATKGGTDRAQRNMLAALNGDTDKSDAAVLAALAGV